MTSSRFDLTSIPLVKIILASRWLQWSLIAALLPFFILAILTGLFGTPSGSRNFGIVFVWIVWWAFLMLLLVPFAGRLWCAICPIPAPGEWLQRRALVQVRPGAKLFTLGWKWPRSLNNIWVQNAAFLAVALFSKVILTSPFVSAMVRVAAVVAKVPPLHWDVEESAIDKPAGNTSENAMPVNATFAVAVLTNVKVKVEVEPLRIELATNDLFNTGAGAGMPQPVMVIVSRLTFP